MKKTLFFVLAFILVACSPQVTITSEVTVTSPPPTETPIPTPTLHPEFIALQNLINDSGERFTLLPDGTIEEVTVNGGRQTVPNLHVDQNGIINIIFNNEHIVIEQSQISFDDQNGIIIEGYKLDENGDWVEATSEAMQTFQADFKKYNASTEQFNVEEKDGNLVVTNAEGEIVYQNGSFEPLFLGQLIVENNMCKQTEWTAPKVGPAAPSNLDAFDDGYFNPLSEVYSSLIKNKIISGSLSRARNYYLGDSCWGVVFFAKLDQSDAWFFWKNPDGKTLYQQVFLPLKE